MGLQFNLINCCYPSHPGVEGARALPRVFSRATPLKNSLLQSYRPQYRSDFGNQLHILTRFPQRKGEDSNQRTRTLGFAVEEAVAEAAMEISEFQGAVESAA
ncbi:hypothetical protein [Methanothrix sp.]|jgi:hypothetical protein|uniref:hypothetical protein n=1 Tax=Methanothrix sp. TaxID=90426 RepID=UPI0025F3A02A|nr:hypothetical protein [Methanothrix sp.]